ncbi:MAG TPA: L,D-transpeptidase family protein [Thermoanaerobaculia bacterium]
MRRHRKLALLVLTFIASVSWARNPGDGGEARDLVASGHLSDLRWPDFTDYEGALASFYEPNGYASAWVRDGRPSPQALALIGQFKDAWKKGLEPEDYDASRWDARLQALNDPAADPTRFDLAMTVCTMRLVSDLRIGRINPRHFDFGLSVDEKKYDLARFLREQVVAASDMPALFDGVEPPYGGYRRTEAALARYIDLARRDDGERLPVPAKPVDPGKPYSGAPRLRQLLGLLGDLPIELPAPDDPQIYDGALVEAVKRFQRRHGLDDDGRLGAATVEQLNVPLSNRVRQLQLALERWRWLPAEFSAPPIVVNIPDFRLRTTDPSGRVVLNMAVVVGKAIRTETPVFSRDMTYVVFRPYWNVPPSILRGEIVPAIGRDRNYIALKGFEVTTPDGKVVTDGPISDDVFSRLKAGKLAVRQKPGPTNALGLVKLMFPNEHNVYLHSTPAPALFSKSRRDFSHGCLRVEKPAELAAWALRNNPEWTLERVQAAMQTGPDNVTVKLARPIPVFIVYATALAYENGEVHFYDDIYGHDASLEKALAKGYPYPG